MRIRGRTIEDITNQIHRNLEYIEEIELEKEIAYDQYLNGEEFNLDKCQNKFDRKIEKLERTNSFLILEKNILERFQKPQIEEVMEKE